jgi:putative nucleotidyltransferase with HDIG domain
VTLRILFVDDEPHVLDGLRRTLRGFRQGWDMRFAQGGPAALAALDQGPADVVVSDMRMPGMDGDVLLAEVRRRFPQTVRIVLTGQCTREALVRVSTSAHRILTKPCDPDSLSGAIAQASTLLGVIHSPSLAAAIGRLRSVPSRPDLYARILNALEDPNASLVDLSRICSQDVGVSAKLIQVANSAAFGCKQPASNPLDAVQRIGSDMTKALVLAEGVLTEFDPRAIHPYSLDDVWPHSQAVAALAARIARREAAGAGWLCLVPSAGVLHDIGRLILASTEPELYVAVLRHIHTDRMTVIDAERRVFGATHAEVGAYLLGLWGLPTAIVEAIAWHHTPVPSACPVDGFSLVTAVHAAEAVLGDGEGDGPDLGYLTRLGLAHRLPAWAALAAQPAAAGGES